MHIVIRTLFIFNSNEIFGLNLIIDIIKWGVTSPKFPLLRDLLYPKERN